MICQNAEFGVVFHVRRERKKDLASDIMLFSSNVLKNNEESYVLQLLPLPEDSKCFNAVPTPKNPGHSA
jgi:hypothetical protein